MITILAARIRALMGWDDSEQGQALVEYSLIMCLVVIVILVTLIVLGNQVRNTYCNIQGAVVGAGITIAFPEASAAWAILGQAGWTVGCDTIPKIYLSGGQVNGLYAYERQHAAAGCFYVWPRNHRTWKIKCTHYYA